MSMLVGIIGAPNKGKSTIFSAMTMASAEIADYPFTTIKPNFGVAYVTSTCVEKELGVKCNPRNSLCSSGVRQIPASIVDVAGLVPDAHIGKGMGNQFLSDLIQADALIQVVDLSGKTDLHGNPAEYADPAEEVMMIRKELAKWLAGILSRHASLLSKRSDGDAALKELLSGFNIDIEQIRKAAKENYLSAAYIKWEEKDMYAFADSLMQMSKPVIIAANKLDKSSKDDVAKLQFKFHNYTVIGCSGALELALRQAAKTGVIEYIPGSDTFTIKGNISTEQRNALDYISNFLRKNGSTGVEELVNTAVFKLLDSIVVYPVEDENKYTDHDGNVLPDALLLKRGSTVFDLAEKIHTDLAKGILYAIDAKRKLRVAKDYVLKDNDVIKIVSTR